MNHLPYRVFMFDIDGTIQNSEKKLLPSTRHIIRQLLSQGALIAIASGRCAYGVMPTAKELELDIYGGYILPYNSGQIIDCKTGRVIAERTLPAHTCTKAFAFASSIGADLMFYQDTTIITNNPENPYLIMEARNNKMTLKKTKDFHEYDALQMHEFLMAGDPENLKQAEPRAREIFGEYADVFRSDPYFLLIVPKGVSKADGLKTILSYHDISREASMAFGDGYNDISMLRYAGIGVAMANAEPPIQAVADFITDSCDADGIAHAIKHFLPAHINET